MRHLTAGQHALLETALQQQLQALDRRLAEQLGGESRAEHAHAVLEQDGDDAPQRDAERELDLARSDRATVSLGELSRALARMADGQYGLCSDCGAAIPLARLQLAPQAQRCVACETLLERGRARPATL
jgi:DnaK suppressor protein